MGYFMDQSAEPWALLVDDWLARPYKVNTRLISYLPYIVSLIKKTVYEFVTGNTNNETETRPISLTICTTIKQ